MRSNYHSVYFEISGFCNARCSYCHSGVQRPDKARFVSPELFRDVLYRLLAKNIICDKTVISLYNWGEPTLNPKLGEIIGVINDLGLRYAISTNASRIPTINYDFVRNLDHMIFSMPGFSQEAYDRIHGFKFHEIISNIDRIIRECRQHGYKGRFSISYHVYRFNVDEMKTCESFADDRRIRFNPYFAILNHWWEINDYIKGTLAPDRRAAAERDLFTLEGVHQVLRSAPKTRYRCPQNDYLNIDENGQVVTCCQIARDHPDYACGNANTDNLNVTLNKKRYQPVCGGCIRSGLAYYLNTALKRPSFYRPSIRQRITLLSLNLEKLSFSNLTKYAIKIAAKIRQQ
ncbi:MAG: radical SAM protein [Verrucomicrobia bacterium]|nr:radical SAM protein [Verrucomicrobiota bacterium]